MGKLRPEREGIHLQPQSRAEHTARPQLLARSPRPACLCFSPGGSPSEWAVLLGPPPTSAAGQLGATCQACREVPSQGAKLCRADSGSLAPSKESENGKREAVESEKHQLARAGEAGASRRGIARRAWPAAGRPFCRPQLLLAAPGLGSPPAHRLAPTSALGQPARPALGGPRCLCGKRRQDPAPQLLAWGAPGSRGTKAAGQPGPAAGAALPAPRGPRGPLQGTVIPSLAAQLFSQRGRDVGPGAS